MTERRGLAGFPVGQVFLIVLAFLFPTQLIRSVAQNANAMGYTLAGTVRAEGSEQGVAYATVELCDEHGVPILETSGNTAGEFFLGKIRPQAYILRARAEGFESTEMQVDLTLGSQRGMSVTLKAASGASPHAGEATISAHELCIPEAARKLMSAGEKKLYREKNAGGALHDFQLAIRKATDFYEAYYQEGVAYLVLGNEAEAEKEFRKAVELSEKKYGNADIGLATLLLAQQKTSEGEALLRTGLQQNPKSWQGQVELGKLELTRGHLAEAQRAAEMAETAAPEQPMVYRLLGLVHLREKNYEALKADLDAYVRLDPESPTGVHAKELRAQLEERSAQAPRQTSCASRP